MNGDGNLLEEWESKTIVQLLQVYVVLGRRAQVDA